MNPIKLIDGLRERGITAEVKSDFLGTEFHNFHFLVKDNSRVTQVFKALESMHCDHWAWHGIGEFHAMFKLGLREF